MAQIYVKSTAFLVSLPCAKLCDPNTVRKQECGFCMDPEPASHLDRNVSNDHPMYMKENYFYYNFLWLRPDQHCDKSII